MRHLVSEEEARGRFCPMLGLMAALEADAGGGSADAAVCKGPECMFWRWAGRCLKVGEDSTPVQLGYCGLAGNPLTALLRGRRKTPPPASAANAAEQAPQEVEQEADAPEAELLDDPQDVIIALAAGLEERVASGKTETLHFADLDRELGLVSGAAKTFTAKAAERSKMEVLSEGATIVRIRNNW